MKRSDWYAFLPLELLHSAYRASNEELAWPKEQALKVIGALNDRGCIVDGVDVWIPTKPGPTIPTPFVYDWALQNSPRDDKYPATAKEFIENFAWDPTDRSHDGLAPVFNISAEKK